MDRYTIRGFIDGLLSTLGIVIGASAAIGGNVDASQIIISAGLGGGVANGLSNLLGALMGEKAALYERYREVDKAMLKDDALKDTKIDEKYQNRVLSSGISDGLATLAGSIIPVLPFVVVMIMGLDPLIGLYSTIAMSLVLFFILGAYIGKLSKSNIIISGLKMAAFGGLTALIVTLIRMVV